MMDGPTPDPVAPFLSALANLSALLDGSTPGLVNALVQWTSPELASLRVERRAEIHAAIAKARASTASMLAALMVALDHFAPPPPPVVGVFGPLAQSPLLN